MSTEGNMALVRRFFEVRGRGDLDTMEEMMAPDFVSHPLLPGQKFDRKGYKRAVAEYLAAFSDARFTMEDQIATSDKVVSRISERGIHDQGEFMGVAPTGKELEAAAIVIHRISGGKIAEEWSQGNAFLMLTQQRLKQEMRERERIEQELRVARRIQQASLLREVPSLEGWQISHLYQPAREVGGDFYDFHLLSEGRLGLLVGDATGKGVPAALVMSTTCGMLRAVSQALGSCSSAEILKQVNEALYPNIAANTFVTCFYAILEPKSGRLTYANAGHYLPYLRHHGGGVSELRATGMPLGLMLGMSYEEKEALLEAGVPSSSTATAWSRPTMCAARCSAFHGCGRWSTSTRAPTARSSLTY